MTGLTPRGGPIDPRSPFPFGARVQLHGYAGCPRGPRRDGFRGAVVGGFGTSAFVIATDGGFDAVENWSDLVADGTPGDSIVACTCCPRRAS